MADPRMFIPHKYEHTTTARRYFLEGWQDGAEELPNIAHGTPEAIQLIIDNGLAVLQAYDDGYKAGQAARSPG